MRHWIAPSILSADFSRLGKEVGAVLAARANTILDNHYVPNLTMGRWCLRPCGFWTDIGTPEQLAKLRRELQLHPDLEKKWR